MVNHMGSRQTNNTVHNESTVARGNHSNDESSSSLFSDSKLSPEISCQANDNTENLQKVDQIVNSRSGKFSDLIDIRRFSDQFDKNTPTSMSASSARTWTCSKCTLINTHSSNRCAACQQMAPRSHQNFENQRPTSTSSSISYGPPGSPIDGATPYRSPPVRQTSESMDILREVEESEAAEQFSQILAYCRINKHAFVDDSFPPNDKSIGRPSALFNGANRHTEPIVWKRPFEIATYDSAPFPWTVYSNPKSTDIVQGLLGNCWFLSALAVLAERSDLLEHVIVTRLISREGVYQIRLCVDGRWRIILVDDYFPCDSRSFMIFSHAKRRQLWVPLIEKALAKIHGTYAALSTGRTIEGLAVLTGAPCISISLEADDSGSRDAFDLNFVWAQLISAKEAGYIMGTSCGAGIRDVNDQEYLNLGLHPRHAYSLLDLRDLHGIRLVQLRNPWGHGEWRGAFSRHSDLWTDELKSHLFGQKLDQFSSAGLFWMPFEEFCKYFDSVDVCKLRNDCREIRLEIPLPAHCLPKNVFVTYITVEETTEIDFALYQTGIRNEVPTKHGTLDLCILIFESDIFGKMGKLVACSERCVKPFVVSTAVLNKGTYLTLCLSFVHWNLTIFPSPEGVLAVHSSKSISAQLNETNPHLIADSLIEFLLKKGEPYSELNDVTIYYSSKKWSGMVIMVENRSYFLSVIAKCNCNESENVVSTRGSLETADVILPRHRQIIILLTQVESSAKFYIRHSLSYVQTTETFLGSSHAPKGVNPKSAHFPPLDETVRGLHQSRVIVC